MEKHLQHVEHVKNSIAIDKQF